MSMRLAAKSPRLFVSILVAACCLPAVESKSDQPDKAASPDADSMIGKEAGQVRAENGLKLKLVWCPSGRFTMGCPTTEVDVTGNHREDENQVQVTLTNGFWLGKFEVTQSEWNEVMATESWKGRDFTKEGDDFPATCVSWEDATEFCRTLTQSERKAGRLPDGWEYTLPTEAQWERACRAGMETRYSFGDDETKLGEYAWFHDNAWKVVERYAHRVGQKKPNPWGVHDMHGNVGEWCRDWYREELPGGRDPEVSKAGSGRVLRGGGWGSYARSCRSATRYYGDPSYRLEHLGFRVALSQSGNR